MSRRLAALQPMGWPIRCSFLVAAACLAGVLLLARRLEPDPRGFGTHKQLGLPDCAFLRATGRLCPTCGMTTSFAWMTRGQIKRSWQANPAGCLNALLAVPVVAWLAFSAVVNQPVGFKKVSTPLTGLIFAAVGLGIASWLIRLIVSPSVLVVPGAKLTALARAIGL